MGLNKAGKGISWNKILKDEKGAVLVFIGVIFMGVAAVAALGVEVGYMTLVRNELQNVADAAALAGARELGHTYEGMTYAQQLAYTSSTAATAITDVIDTIALPENNKVANAPISIAASDIQIGQWNSTSSTFTANMDPPNAVKVAARRAEGTNGLVQTLFGQLFGIDSFSMAGGATAALTGLSTAAPGALEIPIGIPMARFPYCSDITFSPTNDPKACSGWTSLTDVTDQENCKNGNCSSADDIKDILRRMIVAEGCTQNPDCFDNKTYTPFVSPPIDLSVHSPTYDFNGGDVTPAVECFKNLYDCKKDANNKWEVVIPVISATSCDNPTGHFKVVGFTTATITNVEVTPSKYISAKIDCNNTESGRGSGGNYGTYGSIPGLVDKNL